MLQRQLARSMRRGRHALALCALALAVVLAGGPTAAPAQAPLSDEAISKAVRAQYTKTPVVDLNRINVAVVDGVVELTGDVTNLLAKERATRIAEVVRGVRSVVNRIRVQPSPLRDTSIRDAVVAALLADPATDAYDIDVTVKDHAVTLRGTVESWAERDLAETVVKGVEGVVAVDNSLGIDYTQPRTDSEIAREIERRLRWDVLVDGALVEVAVKGGQVTLSGAVGSAAEKRRAWFDAWVTGVKAVDDSELEVSWLVRDEDLRRGKYVEKTDAEIRDAVKDAMTYDPRVFSFKVDVAVHNGMATLSGSVDNMAARQAAAQVARNTVGVVAVTNNVKVRPAILRSDNAIREDVRNRLLSSPTIDSYGLSVRVRDGVVTLSGTLDNAYEVGEAVRIAQSTIGVTDVRNWLDVASGESVLPRYNVYPDMPAYVGAAAAARSDAQIQDDIRSELTWSPFVDADRIYVEVENGRATLRGVVDSWRAYHAAEENAYEGGAVTVDNQIQVIYDTPAA